MIDRNSRLPLLFKTGKNEMKHSNIETECQDFLLLDIVVPDILCFYIRILKESLKFLQIQSQHTYHYLLKIHPCSTLFLVHFSFFN